MANYRQELELEQREISRKIDNLYKELKTDSENFNEIYSEINSLRIDLQAKKDRVRYLNHPVPYMTDI